MEDRRAGAAGSSPGRRASASTQASTRASAPGVSRSSASRARTAASRSAPDGPAGSGGGLPPAVQPLLRGLEQLVGPLPVGCGSGRRAAPAAPPSGRPGRRAAGTRRPGCPWTWTSSRRPGRSCRRARSAAANGAPPVSASACAAEHSWCGKSRSLPPPCTSMRVAEQAQRDDRALDVPAGPARAQGAARPRPARPRGRRATAAGRAGRACRPAPGRRRARRRTPASGRGTGWTRSRTRARPRCRSRRRRCRRPAGTPRRRRAARSTLLGDVRDRLDRADVVRRRDDPQRLHVLAEQRGLAHRQDHPVLAVARGPLQQRVVDVGDVLDVPAPRARRRATSGCTRSKVIMVAAWPRCVASYGVIPQTYIVAGRPARVGWTPRRAESNNASGSPVPGQPRHLGPRPGLHGPA